MKSRLCSGNQTGASLFRKLICLVLLLTLCLLGRTSLQNRLMIRYSNSTTNLTSLRETLSEQSNQITAPLKFDSYHYSYLLCHKPAFTTVRQNEKVKVDLVFGIPTIKRHDNMVYLYNTLESLVENLEGNYSVKFVVMLAAVDGYSTSARLQIAELSRRFHAEIDSHLIEIVVPPKQLYPDDLNRIPSYGTYSTQGDKPNRMYWRTKQNLDYACLIEYCRHMGRYYMQLEDDLITRPNYVEMIFGFLGNKPKPDKYVMYEFGKYGFYGKLFTARAANTLIGHLWKYHRTLPADWILDRSFAIIYCPNYNPNVMAKLAERQFCDKLIEPNRVMSPSCLFQHVGQHSSLAGKVQKIKEVCFSFGNPPATITTSMESASRKVPLYSIYNGQREFISAKPPTANQTIDIVFGDTPNVKCWFLGLAPHYGRFYSGPFSVIRIRTGSVEMPNSILTDVSVEIRIEPGGYCGIYGKTDLKLRGDDLSNFQNLATFDSRGVVSVRFRDKCPIRSVRLLVLKQHTSVVTISQIAIAT